MLKNEPLFLKFDILEENLVFCLDKIKLMGFTPVSGAEAYGWQGTSRLGPPGQGSPHAGLHV